MLLAELACFTYAFNLLLFECRESDYDPFLLHRLELIEIDVANSLVPQLCVGIGFHAFCEHGRSYLVQIENEHSALSSFVRDDSALFFDEITALVESNLHSLLNNLADRDKILRDSWNMQDNVNVRFLTFFVESNIADVPNRMLSVVSGLHGPRSSQNHSWWDGIWFEAPESTNNTSSGLRTIVEV